MVLMVQVEYEFINVKLQILERLLVLEMVKFLQEIMQPMEMLPIVIHYLIGFLMDGEIVLKV